MLLDGSVITLFVAVFAGVVGLLFLLTTLFEMKQGEALGFGHGVGLLAVALLFLPALAPFFVGPRRDALVGLVCLAGASFFAVLAFRARQRFVRAALSLSADSVASALAGLGRDDRGARDLRLRGKLCAEPPLLSPVSQTPCLSYRLEVRRGPEGRDELITFEDLAAERVLLEDRTGRLPLKAPAPRVLRGAPARALVHAGEVDASALALDPPLTRLARVVKKLDPNLPTEGSARYRVVETLVPEGAEAEVVGRLERENGEPGLTPLGSRLEFGAAGAAQRLRRQWMRAGLAAAVMLAAGVHWLWQFGSWRD